MGPQEARKYVQLGFTFTLVLVFGCLTLKAQDYDPNGKPHEDKGPTFSELVSGSSNNVSGMLKLDTSIGWNFTKNFGADIGVPYLFNTRPGLFDSTFNRPGYVSSPALFCTYFFGCYTSVITSSRMWTGEFADVYAEVHYTRTYKKYDLLTNLTGDAPTASYRKGMTSGRAQWDWFNHIDTDLHGFDPFLNFGLANGRMDQHFLPRPYNTDLPFRTLGYLADFEGGVQYKLFRRVTVGGSFWDILPMGPQKIYSNIVWDVPGENVLEVGMPGGLGFGGVDTGGVGVGVSTGNNLAPSTFGYLAGDPNHGRYWNTAFETVGPNYIDRDNGYSATLAFSPAKFMDIQLGYNHSVRYAMDTVVFTVAFNANAVFRKLTNY